MGVRALRSGGGEQNDLWLEGGLFLDMEIRDSERVGGGSKKAEVCLLGGGCTEQLNACDEISLQLRLPASPLPARDFPPRLLGSYSSLEKFDGKDETSMLL